jgi:hypothetical protein
MKPTIIVWDLETVPDLSGFAAANDLVGKSDVEVREAIGEHTHRPTLEDHVSRATRLGSSRSLNLRIGIRRCSQATK